MWLGRSSAASEYEGPGLVVMADSARNSDGGADATAIATAYRSFGLASLAHVPGRYRFILHDARAARLVAGSSTAPPWPLSYWAGSRTTVVGSTLTSLLRCPEVPRALDESYLAHLVTGLAAMSPGTSALQAVKRLRTGEVLVVDADRADVSRVDRLAPREILSGVALLEELAASIDRASSSRRSLISLSGGLDSATLVVAALRRAPEASAMSFVAPALDGSAEIPALDALERTTPRLHTMRVDVSRATELPDLGQLRDDPPLVPLALLPARMQLWATARAVGYGTVIEGEGVDELFSILPTPLDALRRGHLLRVVGDVLASRDRKRLIANALLLPIVPRHIRRAWLARRGERGSCLPAFAVRGAEDHRVVRDAINDYHASLVHRPFEEHVREWLSSPVFVGATLGRRHLASAFDLELHWPVLERGVLEIILGLHETHQLGGRADKSFLRNLLRGTIPEEVRLRPKDIGLYRALIPRVLTSSRLRAALRDAQVRRRLSHLVRFEQVDVMLDAVAAGHAMRGGALWQLECLASFAEWYAHASRELGVD